jgi:hypothetical protein
METNVSDSAAKLKIKAHSSNNSYFAIVIFSIFQASDVYLTQSMCCSVFAVLPLSALCTPASVPETTGFGVYDGVRNLYLDSNFASINSEFSIQDAAGGTYRIHIRATRHPAAV